MTPLSSFLFYELLVAGLSENFSADYHRYLWMSEAYFVTRGDNFQSLGGNLLGSLTFQSFSETAFQLPGGSQLRCNANH